MRLSANKPCPCSSGRKAKGCCLPLLKGAAATSPEALMRSRFTAYSVGASQYIMDTTHPDGPHWNENHQSWKQDIDLFCSVTHFEQLAVLEAKDDQVFFHAILSREGEDCSFAERSTFAHHKQRWCYLSGKPEPIP
ncbi:MAG: YchJ family protein [Myxococcota bacterium]